MRSAFGRRGNNLFITPAKFITLVIREVAGEKVWSFTPSSTVPLGILQGQTKCDSAKDAINFA
jgi:hypothetical protein